jgi:hypothetical protein
MRWLVLGAFTVFGLLEIGLRIGFSPADSAITFDTGSAIDSGRWIRHPFQPFAGKPHYDYAPARLDGSRVGRSNSYGFRSPEFPTVKGPNDYFIVCLGEASDPTWPELLELSLRQQYPSKRITVFNLGTELATSAVSVVNLTLIGIHLLPDLVIVYHGCNEAAAIAGEDFRRDHSHVFRNLKPEASMPRWALSSYVVATAMGARKIQGLNDLRDLVLKPQGAGRDPFKGLAATLRNFDTMHAVAKGREAKTLFSTYRFGDGNDSVHRELNEKLRKFFRDKGFLYVDQAALIPDGDPTLMSDQCDLTRAGQARLADNFAERVVQERILDRGEGMARPSAAIPTEFRTSLDD